MDYAHLRSGQQIVGVAALAAGRVHGLADTFCERTRNARGDGLAQLTER